MTFQIFNRTIFIWAAAVVVALILINPREALVQRLNTMNGAAVDCLREENCKDPKLITQAREYYLVLSQLYPDYGRGDEMQGLCYLLFKQDRMAIKKFKAAVKHNPDLFWVFFELGKALYRQREYARALTYFQAINAQDNNILFKKATLSSLRRLSDQTRGALMLTLFDFVRGIKLQSYQMTVGCFLHLGDMAQARFTVSRGLSDSQMAQDEFFILANDSLGQEVSRKEMLSWIDSLAYRKAVYHPWGQIIPPLKEIMY